jgi:hypothetical protein
MQNTIKFGALFESLRAVPLPAISFFGVVAAVLFNLGYFAAVGVNFMSLFPLQESIVFSITGAVASASVIAAMQGAANFFGTLPSRQDGRGSVVIKLTASSIILVGLMYNAIDQTIRYHGDGGYAVSVPFVVFISIGIAMVLLVLLRKRSWDTNFYALIAMLASISFVMCGLLYGNSLIYGRELKTKSVAILADGREANVVRLGAEYSLVAFGDRSVHAVRTDSLKDIYTKPSH